MVGVGVVAGLAVVVVAVVFRMAHALRSSARETAPLLGTWTQHARRSSRTGNIVVYYPSEAAKDHDTVWSRGGEGTYSVARRMRGTTIADSVPEGPWFRTYQEDFKTLQRKD